MNSKFLLCLFFSIPLCAMKQSDNYNLELLTGKDLESILPFVAQQRIELFREYPYLYEGNLTEEMNYLEWFAKLPHTAMAVAYHDKQPVGFVSGTSFKDFDTHFKGSCDVFLKADLKPEEYYYITEGIVVPEHRGNALALKLSALIEGYAKKIGFTKGCFVDESHDKHPLKPANYYSLETAFKKAGYIKSPLSIKFNWVTRQVAGQARDQEHELYYWMKNI